MTFWIGKESYDKLGNLNELWPTDDNRNGVGRHGVLMSVSLKLLWNLDYHRMKSKNKMEQNNNKKPTICQVYGNTGCRHTKNNLKLS